MSKAEVGIYSNPGWRCPRNADAHMLCAKLAAAEAKVRELEEGDEALLAILPEDFGAVEYIKHLTAANAALEEKLAEADFCIAWQADPSDGTDPRYMGRKANMRGMAAQDAAIEREASRKKGAKHGE